MAKLSAGGALEWRKTFGGAKRDGGTVVMNGKAGEVFIAGMFQGEARFGDLEAQSVGLQDVFVAKLDATGRFVSVNTFAGPTSRRALQHSVPRTLVLKGGGAELQYLDHPAGAFAPSAMALHPGGNIALVGWYAQRAQFGNTTLTRPRGGFVALLDATAELIWVEDTEARPLDVVFDRRGRMIVADSEGYVSWYGSR